MLVRNPWPAAAGQLLLVLAGSAVIGLVSGRFLLCLLAGLALYIAGYHVPNLVRLERWLRRGRRIRPPESGGLWGTIFDSLYRLQRRHHRRGRRLARLLRRFKESANAMPDATVVLQNQGEMQWWNSKAARYLGLRWPQDRGLRVALLLRHPQFAEFLLRRDWREAVKVPSPANERMVLEVRLVPYGRNRQLLLARDVTPLHRLETMRRDFVANISHELRTPLTVIQGLSETLAEDNRGGDMERPLAMIRQQTGRMSRLIDDLLLLSRLETGEREPRRLPVNVPRLLEDLAEEARALSDGRHEIVLEADAALSVEGDEGELRSAFTNLVVNAIKYTPSPGRIVIRWAEDAGAARMTVADTGVGIPAHHLPRLTERFYRVDSGRAPGRGGTGLGLAIVKHVLSRHGARLEVRSQPGEGSTFACVFPGYERRDPGAASARGAG